MYTLPGGEHTRNNNQNKKEDVRNCMQSKLRSKGLNTCISFCSFLKPTKTTIKGCFCFIFCNDKIYKVKKRKGDIRMITFGRLEK